MRRVRRPWCCMPTSTASTPPGCKTLGGASEVRHSHGAAACSATVGRTDCCEPRATGIVRHERVSEALRKCPELLLVHVETIGGDKPGTAESLGPRGKAVVVMVVFDTSV